MKVLVSINSCVKYAQDGYNQAVRDTYLTELSNFPGVDYRFFIGDGTPTGEDESVMRQLMGDCPGRFSTVPLESPSGYVPMEDEVMLPVPDDYIYIPWKVRESIRWTLAKDYDYTFKCFADTYIDLQRLMSSGFENYDYMGRWYGGFAVGGSGYWLSRKAMQCVADAPVTDWSEDRWVGRRVLLPQGINLHGDRRHGASPQQNPGLSDQSPLYPLADNEQITAHLSESPAVYDKQMMYAAHRLRRG